MKIEKLNINGYGQLNNIKINLRDGINIIKGYNEAGKSTLLSFINSSLYGIEKNKSGKNISDFNRYTPWNNQNFSGSILYSLDNGKKYEIFRDFKKNKTLVTDENMNDLTSDFKSTRKGVEILEEQIGIDKTTFKNSAISFQKLVVLDDKDKSQIVQKMTNLVSTGEENLSYNNIIKKISEKQLKEIGNSRTKNRPINEIEEELLKLEEKQNEIIEVRDKKENIAEDRERIQKEFSELENKKNFLNDVREHFLKDSENNRNLDIYNNIRKRQDEIMEKKQLKEDTITIPSIFPKCKKSIIISTIVYIMLIALLFVYRLFVQKKSFLEVFKNNKNIIFLAGISIIFVLSILLTIFLAKKKTKRELEKLEGHNREIEKEILLLRKEIMDYEKQLERIQRNSTESDNRFYKLMKIKYMNKVDKNYIDDIIAKKAGEVAIESKKVEKKYETTVIDLSRVEAEKKLLEISGNKLAEVIEEKENLKNRKKELEDYNNSFEIAKELLEESYNEMKDNLGPGFNQRFSYITEKITGGKYKEVKINRDQKVMVKTDMGDVIDLSLLSTGTIEQINLALRLAILEHITTEKLPIIVDEAFAFYDDERLENTIEFIYNEYKNRQIIMFTCSKREMQAVDKLGIDVNYINI